MRNSAAAGELSFWASLKFANAPAGFLRRSLQWRNAYDSCESCLEPDSIERSSLDAPGSPVARAEVVSDIDDTDDAPWRRLAVVLARIDSCVVRWRASLRSARRWYFVSSRWHFSLSRAQAREQAQEAVRNRAALLGRDPAA